MKTWPGLLAAETVKLRRLVVLRAVGLSLLLGPGVMIVILSLVTDDIHTIVEAPMEIILGIIVLLAAFGGVVLAAAMLGREFDLGTVRATLLRGVPRPAFLLTKIAAAILAMTVLSFIAALLGVGATVLAGWAPTSAEAVGTITQALWLVPLASLAYIGFTALGAILGHSVAAGMLAGLALFLGDFLLMTLRIGIPFGEWLPVANLFALLGKTFDLGLSTGAAPSAGVAALRLAGFGGVTVIVGLLLFERMDVQH